MTTSTDTALQRLATRILDNDVRDYIATRRTDGMSWRRIAAELLRDTDGEIDVTYETLRSWHGEAAS
jgi:hypothetical protein